MKPIDTIPDCRIEPLTKAGQIVKGDTLLIRTSTGGQVVTAINVIRPGVSADSDGEEIVIDKRKNFYFITKMYLEGKSWVKSVHVLRWI